jgi:general L-amino acid transport system permease protein
VSVAPRHARRVRRTNLAARRIAAQALFLLVLAAVLAWLGRNLVLNQRLLGIETGYDFLRQPAGFDIAGSDFQASDTVLAALRVGALHTVAVSAAGIVLATGLGLVVGIARLSPNWLLRRIGALFVETFRNVPVLVTIVFMYEAIGLKLPAIEDPLRPFGVAVVSNRGIWIPWAAPARGFGALWGAAVLGVAAAGATVLWLGRRRSERATTRRTLWVGAVLALAFVAGWAASGVAISVPQPAGRVVTGGLRLQTEFAALLAGLVLYTSSHIAEIVRASIQAVPRGQGEAAEALGLSSFQRLRLVVVPQALRIMVPPLANQYLNLTKNSSLGVAVAYAELTLVTRIASASGSPAPQAISVLIVVYLALSLAIAASTNLLNRRLLAAWR